VRLEEQEIGRMKIISMEGSAVHIDLYTHRGHVCWRIDRHLFAGREPDLAFIEDLHEMVDSYRLGKKQPLPDDLEVGAL